MSYSTGSSAVRIFVVGVVELVAAPRTASSSCREPVGPGDDDDAVGLLDQLLELVELVVAQPDPVEAQLDVGAVEHAHHDGLAEHRRQHGDAQVDRVAVDHQLDAAVLRQAPLGDVEVRHDLDAADDRQREVLRRRDHLVEDAVDAVAHLELVLERLEVDVGGLVLDRLEQHEVEQPDDLVVLGRARRAPPGRSTRRGP